MVDAAKKRVTVAEFEQIIRRDFDPQSEVVTFTLDFFVKTLAQVCYDLQLDTELRVREEMLKWSNN